MQKLLFALLQKLPTPTVHGFARSRRVADATGRRRRALSVVAGDGQLSSDLQERRVCGSCEGHVFVVQSHQVPAHEDDTDRHAVSKVNKHRSEFDLFIYCFVFYLFRMQGKSFQWPQSEFTYDHSSGSASSSTQDNDDSGRDSIDSRKLPRAIPKVKFTCDGDDLETSPSPPDSASSNE